MNILIGEYIPNGDMGRGYYLIKETRYTRKGSMSIKEFEDFQDTCNVSVDGGKVYLTI